LAANAVKLSKSAATVADNANDDNNEHVTVAHTHTSYRDATASDVVTDETERSMNWEQPQQSTVTMVSNHYQYRTIHYYRSMIDDS
jgi:hypothetical protein